MEENASVTDPRASDINAFRPGANARKKSKTSIACITCRTGRRKCDGGQPCETCSRKNVDCTYPTEPDGRTKESRTYKFEEAQRDSDLLHNLIETVRNSRDDEVGQILSLIRSNATIGEIQRCVEQKLIDSRLARRERSPELEQLHERMKELPDSQQQSCLLGWQPERTGYAVPGYTRTFGNLPFSSSVNANWYPASIQARQNLNFFVPDHLIFPLADVDESPLGRAVTDFQQLGRRLIAQGLPPTQVADQGLIDVTLFFRRRLPEDPLNASTWASEMLSSFRGTFSDQLLLACAVCVGTLMRWFLMPTPENYSNIPSIARPTHMQRFKPHPAWVDLMIFPSFRNALIHNLRDWVEPCIKAKWEFLWPYPLEEALVRHAHTQQIFLTPDFSTYVDNPKNWLMQRSILEEFSEIQASEINISQEEYTPQL